MSKNIFVLMYHRHKLLHLINEIISTLIYEEGKFPYSVIFHTCNILELNILFNYTFFSFLFMFANLFMNKCICCLTTPLLRLS
jgi:hypothetical protein